MIYLNMSYIDQRVANIFFEQNIFKYEINYQYHEER